MTEESPGPSGRDVPKAASVPDDHLPTTRLPPIAPPPAQDRKSAAGPSSSSLSSGETDSPDVVLPKHGQAIRNALSWERILAFFENSRVGARKTSALDPALRERLLTRRLGVASVLVGLALVIGGIVLGLRGAPASLAPIVAAAVVLARAFVGLGMVGLGVGFLRLGERLLSR